MLGRESAEMPDGGKVGDNSVTGTPKDPPYAVTGLSHIAIAVPDLSAAAEHYRRAFGAQVSQAVAKADQGVTVVFVQLPNLCIELIQPLIEGNSVAKFLLKHPKGGIHHICLAVDDIAAATDYLSSEVKVSPVGSGTPRVGAAGDPILFLHPKDNHGVLIELEQTHQLQGTKNSRC
jgi:methylmalonyl-CoA/ethylmalonyl-CoA epimerase